MFSFLASFFGTILYVQLAPDRLCVRSLKSGAVFSEPPEIAFEEGRKRIAAIGSEARSHRGRRSVEIVNPFAHPRSLVSDFIAAEHLLKAVFRRLGMTVFRRNHRWRWAGKPKKATVMLYNPSFSPTLTNR